MEDDSILKVLEHFVFLKYLNEVSSIEGASTYEEKLSIVLRKMEKKISLCLF
jgi:hypothetical protein